LSSTGTPDQEQPDQRAERVVFPGSVQQSGPIHGQEAERAHVRDAEALGNVSFVGADSTQNITHRMDGLGPVEVEWTGVKLPAIGSPSVRS
jgi:hypothetical protein